MALSVGHPNAYATAGVVQKLKGWYTLMFQWRGGAEWLLKCGDWALFRRWAPHPEESSRWIARLSAPGRLTAAINYYRANLGRLLLKRYAPTTMPVLGVFSSRDRYLTEEQMVESSQYVTGHWQYRHLDGIGHWMTLDAPDTVNALLIDYFATLDKSGTER